MWPILLKILSIIGIVLLCILGVIVFLLLLILLCPVTYRIKGDTHSSDFTARVKIKYLFGIVRAGFEYPEPGEIYAKILWFELYNSGKLFGNKSSNESDNELNNSDETDIEESVDNQPEDNQYEDQYYNDMYEEGYSEAVDESINFESDSETLNVDETFDENIDENIGDISEDFDLKKKNKKKHERKNPIYLLKKKFYEIKHKTYDKLLLLLKDVSFYKKLLEHDDTQILLNKIKRNVFKILKVIAPKKGHVNVVYGMDSPDTTAIIYGLASVIYTAFPKTFTIIPNFDEKILDADVDTRGSFMLIQIVWYALPIVLSKKLRLTKARIDAHMDNKERAKMRSDKAYNKLMKDLETEYSQ